MPPAIPVATATSFAEESVMPNASFGEAKIFI
jgi:hypothetical protein